MRSFTDRDREVVRRTPLFAGLSDEMLDRLLAHSGVNEYERGKLLFLRGQHAERFFLMLNGWVKLFRDTPDGEQTVIAIIKPGETLAAAAIFMGFNYPVSAEVVSDARILEIPAKPFLKLIRDDAEFSIKMLGALSLRLHDLVVHIEQIQARSTSQRLGDFLLSLSEEEETSADVHLPYDKSLIAARLGMKPESLSRALAKLRKFGVEPHGTDVMLSDIPKLRKFCGDGD